MGPGVRGVRAGVGRRRRGTAGRRAGARPRGRPAAGPAERIVRRGVRGPHRPSPRRSTGRPNDPRTLVHFAWLRQCARLRPAGLSPGGPGCRAVAAEVGRRPHRGPPGGRRSTRSSPPSTTSRRSSAATATTCVRCTPPGPAGPGRRRRRAAEARARRLARRAPRQPQRLPGLRAARAGPARAGERPGPGPGARRPGGRGRPHLRRRAAHVPVDRRRAAARPGRRRRRGQRRSGGRGTSPRTTRVPRTRWRPACACSCGWATPTAPSTSSCRGCPGSTGCPRRAQRMWFAATAAFVLEQAAAAGLAPDDRRRAGRPKSVAAELRGTADRDRRGLRRALRLHGHLDDAGGRTRPRPGAERAHAATDPAAGDPPDGCPRRRRCRPRPTCSSGPGWSRRPADGGRRPRAADPGLAARPRRPPARSRRPSSGRPCRCSTAPARRTPVAPSGTGACSTRPSRRPTAPATAWPSTRTEGEIALLDAVEADDHEAAEAARARARGCAERLEAGGADADAGGLWRRIAWFGGADDPAAHLVRAAAAYERAGLDRAPAALRHRAGDGDRARRPGPRHRHARVARAGRRRHSPAGVDGPRRAGPASRAAPATSTRPRACSSGPARCAGCRAGRGWPSSPSCATCGSTRRPGPSSRARPPTSWPPRPRTATRCCSPSGQRLPRPGLRRDRPPGRGRRAARGRAAGAARAPAGPGRAGRAGRSATPCWRSDQWAGAQHRVRHGIRRLRGPGPPPEAGPHPWRAGNAAWDAGDAAAAAGHFDDAVDQAHALGHGGAVRRGAAVAGGA